jgi:hypothetical protein
MLEASGCTRLDIGLESADDETLQLMDKGYTRAEIKSFLESFSGSSIQLLINIIVDYPGLSYERAMDAARFLGEATRGIDNVHFEVLRFVLGRNSAMYRTPEKFGLEILPPGAHGHSGLVSPTQAAFRSRWAMSEPERDRVEACYRTLNASFRERRARLAAESGLLSCAPDVLRGWDVRVEPIVVARSDAVGSGSLVIRRMLSGDTFVVADEYRPLLAAYQRATGRTVALQAFLDSIAADLRTVALTASDCVELLADLDLVRPRTSGAPGPIRMGISSDRNFYRGGVRSSSPSVTR